MKRIASTAIAATVMAIFGLSGEAAAFTPVPIPTPRTGSLVVAHAVPHELHAIAPKIGTGKSQYR